MDQNGSTEIYLTLIEDLIPSLNSLTLNVNPALTVRGCVTV